MNNMCPNDSPGHTWNVRCNAQSSMFDRPKSPNTVPARTKDIPKSQRNLRKKNVAYSALSENGERMKPWFRNPPRNRRYSSRPPRALCFEKYNIPGSAIIPNFIEYCAFRPRKVTLELHEILRLPRNVSDMVDLLHTWNVICHPRSNKFQPPSSANMIPTMKNIFYNFSFINKILCTMRVLKYIIDQRHKILRQ